MSKDKYNELITNIVDLVGGKSNITYFTHCVTRLRINVKDRGLVQMDKIDELPNIVGTQWSGEQLQIIIGQAVGDVYKEIMAYNGMQTDSEDEQPTTDDKTVKKEKKKFNFGMILDTISGCISPLIPVLIGSGMIKVIVLVGESLGWMSESSSTYQVLTFCSDAGFYFLPIFVGAATAKKFGGNEGLGMLIGAITLHPTFTAAIADGTSFTIFGLPIYGASYANTIFPAMMSVFVMSYVQKFISKHSPEAVRSITEPLLTILVMIPITLVIVGPLGAILGNYFVEIVLWLYNTAGFLGVALLAALIPFVVMTGMHTAFVPYLLQMYATVKYEPIFMPALIVSNLNQGIACFVVSLKTKDTKLKATAASCAVTALVGGVTEPALFGVTMKLKTPLYGSMIGSFAGGAYVGITHTYNYALGNGGLLGLTTYIGPNSSNLINMIIGVCIGMAVTFVATYMLYKEKTDDVVEKNTLSEGIA